MLMLKLKLQYFGHLMQRADSLEKTMMLGKIEHRSRRVWQRIGWLDGITNLMDMRLSKLKDIAQEREVWRATFTGSQELDTTYLLNNNNNIFTGGCWIWKYILSQRLSADHSAHCITQTSRLESDLLRILILCWQRKCLIHFPSLAVWGPWYSSKKA